MKLNKYIFAALITSTTLFLGSCSDFLDRSPQGQFTEDDNPNALVNGKIYNVYTMMRNYNVTAGPPAFAIHCFRSEDSEKGSIASDGSDVAEMYDDFVYTPTNGLLGAYWGQNYAIIYQCNEILDAIAEKETAGQTETEDIINKGEASFFRAYCYFNLVRAFGEVPLVTYKINDASEANIPKTSADKIYEQIDKDLKTAEESLPETWSSEYTGRLTWGAARSLHARTYMMRNDWNNMYTASTDVIKKGLYNLKTPYNEIFTDDGENKPLPPFLKAMLSVASSVKYRVCAEQVNGTWAGDGTWQQNTWRKPTNRVIHAKTLPYSTSATRTASLSLRKTPTSHTANLRFLRQWVLTLTRKPIPTRLCVKNIPTKDSG